MQRERLDPFLDKKYITCVFFFSKRQGLFNKKKRKKRENKCENEKVNGTKKNKKLVCVMLCSIRHFSSF